MSVVCPKMIKAAFGWGDPNDKLLVNDYGRKYAYKNFCDGIAGYNISSDFNGDDWEKFYQESTEGGN